MYQKKKIYIYIYVSNDLKASKKILKMHCVILLKCHIKNNS